MSLFPTSIFWHTPCHPCPTTSCKITSWAPYLQIWLVWSKPPSKTKTAWSHSNPLRLASPPPPFGKRIPVRAPPAHKLRRAPRTRSHLTTLDSRITTSRKARKRRQLTRRPNKSSVITAADAILRRTASSPKRSYRLRRKPNKIVRHPALAQRKSYMLSLRPVQSFLL